MCTDPLSLKIDREMSLDMSLVSIVGKAGRADDPRHAVKNNKRRLTEKANTEYYSVLCLFVAYS